MSSRWRLFGVSLSRCMAIYGRRKDIIDVVYKKRNLLKQSALSRSVAVRSLSTTSFLHYCDNKGHDNTPSSSSSESESSSDSDSDTENIDATLASVAKSVAQSLPGDETQTENDLMDQLKEVKLNENRNQNRFQEETEDEVSKPKSALASLMRMRKSKKIYENKNMAHGQEETDGETEGETLKPESVLTTIRKMRNSKEESVRRRGESTPSDLKYKSVEMDDIDILNPNYKRLGVFMKTWMEDVQAKQSKQEKVKSLWDVAAEEKLHMIQFGKIHNGFQEQMKLTKEGKLWKFPIDNEQDWVEEENVSFHEHVLLERHLKDFPRTGPIRHFMELVTAALSNNPYLSVEEKEGHIDWFRKYFVTKQSLYKDSLEPQDLMKTATKSLPSEATN